MTKMNFAAWLAAAASFAALNAFAADNSVPAPTAAQEAAESAIESAGNTADKMPGPPIDSICNACGIVTEARAEKRKATGEPNTAPATMGGAVAGAIIGNQVGNGKAGATVVGAVAGGVAGSELAKRNAPQVVTTWIVAVTFKDGSKRRFQMDSNPGFKAGDVVRVYNGQLFRG